ncbi:hypothetical protein E2562_017960, partial [Oryza meyeriana var. granulata]
MRQGGLDGKKRASLMGTRVSPAAQDRGDGDDGLSAGTTAQRRRPAGDDGSDCPAAATWKQSKAAAQCAGEEQAEAAVKMVTMNRVDMAALADGD